MKFSRIIGKIDPHLIAAAEEKLSKIFLELGSRYTNQHLGSEIGGDPLIFSLMYPVNHIATLNISTAGTDGKRYYWNPKFILKQHPRGLRIICAHEAWHAIYMHPSRRGIRLPKLWNIAVDYIVNATIMQDLKGRGLDPHEYFTKYLGRYMPLETYLQFVKNPFAPIPGFEDLNPMEATGKQKELALPAMGIDRELSSEEKKELERREKKIKFYFADSTLDEKTRRPEKIYDSIYTQLPKCPKCGQIGIYPIPSDKHSHDKPDELEDPTTCDHGGGVDVFGLGGTMDDHIDSEESPENMAKRLAEAMESNRRLAGYTPAALEEELGKLTAAKITWQDIVRTRLLKARNGHGRNDWTRFRTRPMFSGILIPKKKVSFATFGCLIDTSGSMSKDNIAFGVSQLAALDERSEGTIIPADATIYWDKATKIKKAIADEISKIKIVGRGGTKYSEFFRDYLKNIGPCDLLIVITDGFLLESDIAEMIDPGVETVWLITSGVTFIPPFGRAFDLMA